MLLVSGHLYFILSIIVSCAEDSYIAFNKIISVCMVFKPHCHGLFCPVVYHDDDVLKDCESTKCLDVLLDLKHHGDDYTLRRL